MAIFKLQEKNIKTVALTATAVFFAFAIFFFLPIKVPHKITLTVGSAFIASLWLCPWQITLALLFSALGDYFGSCHNFLAQMGFFALGHVFYVCYFVKRWLRKVEFDKKLTTKVKGQILVYLVLVGGILFVAFTKVIPCAEAGIIRTGVSIYAILISTMLFSALMQRSSLFALGAVFFVFSDFILAWHRFVQPVPYRQYLVLVSYFLAQWLLFVRSTPYRIQNLRLLRF